MSTISDAEIAETEEQDASIQLLDSNLCIYCFIQLQSF